MKTNAIILIAVMFLLAAVGGFFLFRDGTEKLTASSTSEETSDTEMTVPAPGAENNVDEMIVDDEAMMEREGMENKEETSSMKPPSSDENMHMQAISVTYTDEGFTPKNMTIVKGDTVTFINKSSRDVWPASAMHPTHTVYDGTSLSQHCPDTTATAFDSCESVAPDSSWTFTFTKAGEWTYHDHLNPRNTGKVIVE